MCQNISKEFVVPWICNLVKYYITFLIYFFTNFSFLEDSLDWTFTHQITNMLPMQMIFFWFSTLTPCLLMEHSQVPRDIAEIKKTSKLWNIHKVYCLIHYTNKPERGFSLQVRCRKLRIFLRNCLEHFWIFWGNFLELFWNFEGNSLGIFLEDFLEEFFGWNFLEDFFGSDWLALPHMGFQKRGQKEK